MDALGHTASAVPLRKPFENEAHEGTKGILERCEYSDDNVRDGAHLRHGDVALKGFGVGYGHRNVTREFAGTSYHCVLHIMHALAS